MIAKEVINKELALKKNLFGKASAILQINKEENKSPQRDSRQSCVSSTDVHLNKVMETGDTAQYKYCNIYEGIVGVIEINKHSGETRKVNPSDKECQMEVGPHRLMLLDKIQ